MGFIFSEIFWGAIIVLFGLSILVNVIFHINIPIFRIFIGFIIIYFGIKVIVGGQWSNECKKRTQWKEVKSTHMNYQQNEYNTLFGKGVIDLKTIPMGTETYNLSLNTIFAETTLKLDPAKPVKISTSAAFAGARFPDGNLISFGDYVYKSPNFKEDQPYIFIKSSVVFGKLDIVE